MHLSSGKWTCSVFQNSKSIWFYNSDQPIDNDCCFSESTNRKIWISRIRPDKTYFHLHDNNTYFRAISKRSLCFVNFVWTLLQYIMLFWHIPNFRSFSVTVLEMWVRKYIPGQYTPKVKIKFFIFSSVSVEVSMKLSRRYYSMCDSTVNNNQHSL